MLKKRILNNSHVHMNDNDERDDDKNVGLNMVVTPPRQQNNQKSK